MNSDLQTSQYKGKNGKTNRIQGFNLIELVVVILIIGILAAVAAPKMFDTVGDAKRKTAKQSLVVLREAIDMYKNDNGSYPANAAALLTSLTAYLKGPFPNNPLLDNSGPATAVDVTSFATTSGTSDWLYDNSNLEGKIAINHADQLTD